MGADVNRPLRPRKAASASGPQENPIGGSQAGESWGDGAVVPDESPVKVCESQEPLEGFRSVGTFSGSMVMLPAVTMYPRKVVEAQENSHFSAFTNSRFSRRRWSTLRM